MATQTITTANKPIAANLKTARQQYVASFDAFDIIAGQLENAENDAAVLSLSGTNSVAIRDIITGIRDLMNTNNYDTVTKEWIVTRLEYFKTLRNQYE